MAKNQNKAITVYITPEEDNQLEAMLIFYNQTKKYLSNTSFKLSKSALIRRLIIDSLAKHNKEQNAITKSR